MRNLLITAALLLTCLTAYAGFGGGRSSFSSSSSRSSFGGSRSSGSVTISRPAPVASRPTVINHTTVVHTNNGYRSSNGLVTGMLVGAALSQPRVIVARPQQQVVYADAQQPQTVVVQQHSNPWLTIFGTIAIVVVIVIIFSTLL